MCPVGLTGLSKVETIFCPSTSGGQSARFSAIVLPACRKAAESARGGQGSELRRVGDFGAAKDPRRVSPGRPGQ